MIKLSSVLCFIAIGISAQPAAAQVTLDMSKVTCEQWAGYKITNPQNIALWLSGYQNGRRGNTVLDTQELNANVQKLRDFCIVNSQVLVMQAADKLFAEK